MIFIDELEKMKVYKRPFYMPINENNKKKGSLMFLLTPNYKSSLNVLRNPLMINKKLFSSYFIEKDITYYLNQENMLIDADIEMEAIQEGAMIKHPLADILDCENDYIDSDELNCNIKPGKNIAEIHHLNTLNRDKTRLGNIDKVKIKTKQKQNVNKAKENFLKNQKVRLSNPISSSPKLSNPQIAKPKLECVTESLNITISKNEELIKRLCRIYILLGIKDSKNIKNKSIRSIIKKIDKSKYVDRLKDIEISNSNANIFLKDMDENYSGFIRYNDFYKTLKSEYSDFNNMINEIENDLIGIEEYDHIYDEYLKNTKNNHNTKFTNKVLKYLKFKDINIKFKTIVNIFDDRYSQGLPIDKENAIILIANKGNSYDIILSHEILHFYINNIEFDDKFIKSLSNGLIDDYQMKNYIIPESIIYAINIRTIETMLNIDTKYLNHGNSNILYTEYFYNALLEYEKQNKPFDTFIKEYTKKIEFDENTIIMNESDIVKTHNIDAYIEDAYFRCKTDNDVMIIFNENLDENIADSKKHSTMLRKILYKERLKNNKQVFKLYDKLKNDVDWIDKTYASLDKYKKRNLIVDLSFYNQAFFKNNMYKSDKAVQLYFDFIDRFIKDERFQSLNYTKKTVFVPVLDWYTPDNNFYSILDKINPISMILRLIKKDPNKLQMWKGIDFIFETDKGYFKADLSELNIKTIPKFKMCIDKLLSKAEIIDNDNSESTKAIVANIIDKIETSQNVKINNLTGNGEEITRQELDDKINKAEISSKDAIVDKVKKAAEISNNTDQALDILDNDDHIKKILAQLAQDEDNSVKINASRAARITKLQNNFLEKRIGSKSVKDMIEEANNNIELPKTELKIDTVNDEWKELQYVNFEKIYNPDDDIMAILSSLSNKTLPVMVRDIKIEDASTSEDYIKTYNIQMEDAHGNRFTIKFDVPDLIDHKFLMLRGNKKTINGQLMQIPIMKTEEDTIQIVSNYNKIFIRRFGTTLGKSFPTADRVIKALLKLDNNKVKIKYGDNIKINNEYIVPMDYLDMSSMFTEIELPNSIIYFDQKKIHELYKVDDKKGLPIIYDKKNKCVEYYDGEDYKACSSYILKVLCNEIPEFQELYDSTNTATRYTYSKASILNSQIPLIVIMGYSEGLIKAMDKANIKYEISEKRKYKKNDSNYDTIKFNDGFISYEMDYNSVLLMNGLKECNTEDYSLTEINSKNMFLDFLEIFGGRILADGLDNFYDLMIDPITKDVLKRYQLPTDYIELLGYANLLLCDNKYIAHTDMSGRRYRSNEIIAGYAYKAISESYGNYKSEFKKKGKATMKIKQSAILDNILLDPTASDVSVLNDLGLLEAINTISYKGLSGMNSDRSYSLDKRTYNKSMVNILGLSTGFAGNVGITRQSTLDMNVESKRGYLKIDKNPNNMNITKTFTATEALTPFGVTRDDPFRSAMTFIQTSKHGMRIKKGSPSLISNGADQALPYLTPNIFSFKAKSDGKVTEKTDDYMIIKYKNGETDFVDLRSQVQKNSNGGFYTELKLDSDLKVGSNVKPNQIVAYDKLSYSNKIGHTDDIAYNLGALAKIAILNTDEGYEDSTIISEWLSDAMTSEVIDKKEVILSKDTNIFNMVKIGDAIQEGDPLLIFQNAFDDEDVNVLLKNLAIDSGEEVSDIGRIPIKSHVTGIVQDIKIYRTVDKEDLSDSLKKKVNELEKPINNLKKVMDKNGIKGSNRLEPTDRLEPTGKLKNVQEGVLIEFFLKYEDKMSIGDKLINFSALKGVCKDIFPEGKEPKSEFRPDEKIHTLLSKSSIDGRMVGSILINGGINKTLIELDRAVKDILGIKWKYLDEM